jgi:hypothetical protein
MKPRSDDSADRLLLDEQNCARLRQRSCPIFLRQWDLYAVVVDGP